MTMIANKWTKMLDSYPGRQLLDGKFCSLKLIGSGGMGSVYRAQEPALNREVAIKLLHPKFRTRSDVKGRFRREARAMSQLTHPHTVRVYQYGELEDGSPYIVMELLEGKNLHETIRTEGPLSPSRGVPIFRSTCHALHEAHQMGIVHRDLKSENILICSLACMKDYTKVIDFGLAKVTVAQMGPGSVLITHEGAVFGTPEFMSPEQARGESLDARSDIYSLACIFYEALTGKLPIEANGPMDFVSKHISSLPIPLDRRVAGLSFPRGLDDVLAKSLSKSPSERYQTALEFSDALKPFGDSAIA